MKVCASCGASLPDGAAFCISCGSKEFRSESMPDLNAPQPEKPKIEYDQYGRPIGQQYLQSQYEEPRFSDLSEDYDQNYSTYSDTPRYLDQYSEQLSQYEQQQYAQPQYEQQQYAQPQYEQQQYAQPQYEQQQYAQPQYEQQQYAQPQYEQQQYAQPQYEQQQYAQPQYEQQQYSQSEPEQQTANYYQSEHTEYTAPENEKEEDFDPYEAAEKKDDYDPYEAAKNFKFEKKTDDETPAAEEEKPKDLKGYLAKFQDTKDHTYEYDQNTFAANKMYCKLAVLGITFWVPFVAAKDCGSARFYANQGLLIFIIELILLIPELIFTGIIGVGLTLGAQIIVGIILDLIITAVVYAVPIFMIVTAFKNIDEGKVKDVPFVGKIRILR